MRKISNNRSQINNPHGLDDRHLGGDEHSSSRPRRIPGATITAWHGSPEVDLSVLFARPALGATVAGSAPAKADRRSGATVSLSDGTRITFATAG